MKTKSRKHRAVTGLPFSHTVVLIGTLLLAGCGDNAPRRPARVVKPSDIRVSGDEQADFTGTTLALPLKVRVVGQRVPGLLGGKGSEPPVEGAEVEFRLSGACRGASLSSPAARTDGGGIASTELTLGHELGDIFVEARIREMPEVRPTIFRAASGLRVFGQGQDGHVGECLQSPTGVEIRGTDGAPISGVRVAFLPVENGTAGRVSSREAVTDEEGRAQSEFTLGKKSGRCLLEIVVCSPEKSIVYRPFRVRAFSLDLRMSLITVAGGLALFIFGMRLLAEGLQKVAGEKLRKVLQLFTRNRFVGLATGAAVTGIIQSSSATTVMLVGFLNAGLMRLEQALGVILGANIGTTVTAQMISLKLQSLALPAVAVGVAISLTAKRKSLQFWGQAIAGFGILFLGLVTMESVLKPLSNSHTIMAIIGRVDCSPGPGGSMSLSAPLMAIALGTLMTVLVQSSSASIGLLMAAAAAGLLNFYTAIPILLGDNIGTTITAHLAAIGGGTPAKRAAWANSLFKVFGTCAMFALFFVPWNGQPVFMELMNRLTAGNVFAGENIERHIANAHTLFNVIDACVMLPLVPVMAWLVRWLVPTREDEEELIYLEPHLLDTPALALERSVAETVFMARLAHKSIDESFHAFRDRNHTLPPGIRKREEKIDRRQEEITNYLVQLTQRDMSEVESRQLPLLIHTVNDLERIGDHAENLVELAERRVDRKLPFTETALGQLSEFFGLVDRMFELVIQAVEKADHQAAKRALEYEQKINAMEDELQRGHQKRLEAGDCNVISGVVFLDVVANLEKVGDHLTNVAEAFEASREWRELATP